MNRLYLDIIDTCDTSPHPSRLEYKALKAISEIFVKEYDTAISITHHVLPELLKKSLQDTGDSLFSSHILIIPPSTGFLHNDDGFSSIIQKSVSEGLSALSLHFCYTEENITLTETFGAYYNREVHRLKDPLFKLELGYASFLPVERFAALKIFQLEYDEMTLSISPKYKNRVEPLVTTMDFPIVTANSFGKGFAFSFGFHSLDDPVVTELLSHLLLFISRNCNY